MVTLDYTVSISNLIEIAGIVGAFLTMFYTMRADIGLLRVSIQSLEEKQHMLHSAFERLSAILTQVAVQDTRISMVEKSVDELRHGEGYIKTR